MIILALVAPVWFGMLGALLNAGGGKGGNGSVIFALALFISPLTTFVALLIAFVGRDFRAARYPVPIAVVSAMAEVFVVWQVISGFTIPF